MMVTKPRTLKGDITCCSASVCLTNADLIPMEFHCHATLVYRLVQILIKLNAGEKLDPQDLDLAPKYRLPKVT